MSWTRAGYPSGESVEHAHADGSVGHSHAGGDVPHGHLHRRAGDQRWVDEYYVIEPELPPWRPMPELVCPVAGCSGDARYSAPGRGHAPDCTYGSGPQDDDVFYPRAGR